MTRVLREELSWRSLSYVCGGSRFRSLKDDVEPGDGWRRWREGRAGDWKVWSLRETPSKRCWGAMFEGWCSAGVSVRETGEWDRSEPPDDVLCDTRRLFI